MCIRSATCSSSPRLASCKHGKHRTAAQESAGSTSTLGRAVAAASGPVQHSMTAPSREVPAGWPLVPPAPASCRRSAAVRARLWAQACKQTPELPVYRSWTLQRTQSSQGHAMGPETTDAADPIQALNSLCMKHAELTSPMPHSTDLRNICVESVPNHLDALSPAGNAQGVEAVQILRSVRGHAGQKEGAAVACQQRGHLFQQPAVPCRDCWTAACSMGHRSRLQGLATRSCYGGRAAPSMFGTSTAASCPAQTPQCCHLQHSALFWPHLANNTF